MSAGPPVAALFLNDGGQTAEWVASNVAQFISGATLSLDIAIYDMRLEGRAADVLASAVAAAKARGVQVRLLFNVEHQKKVPVPPPSMVDFDLVNRLGVPFHPIQGIPDLMHHKYVVRDPGEASAAVLTGSANWTTDSWTREENVIVWVSSRVVADAYLQDFEELWTTRSVAASGHVPVEWTEPSPGLRIRPYFTPGRSHRLVHELSHRIATAQRRIRVCSPVITAGPILGTLAEVITKPQLDVAGIVDATQMTGVLDQWSVEPVTSWKVAAFNALIHGGQFSGKRSTPYFPGSVHDFMHAKITVVDDTVFVGSYNLSSSGEENAENVLEIEHAALANLFTSFVDRIAARYPRV